MCKENGKISNEHIIVSYIKGAFKLEFNSDSGKINFCTFLGSLILAFFLVLPDKLLEIGKTIYSMCKLDSIYESKIDLTPLYISVGCGILCFVLMGFIFEKQVRLKEQVNNIKNNEEDDKQ